MKVLILTHRADAPRFIEKVCATIAARGAEPHVFYVEDFPVRAKIVFEQDADGERFLFNGVAIGAGDVIWGRRYHAPLHLPEGMDPEARRMAVSETERQLHGILAACPAAKVDRYAAVRGADHKPLQQRIFREAGIRVPRTLATNDPEAAAAFLDSCPEGAVAKMLAVDVYRKPDGGQKVMMTTKVPPQLRARLGALRLAPMYFQELVKKDHELRVTIFGTKIFAARINSQAHPGGEVDWRNVGLATIEEWTAATIPPALGEALLRYQRAVGLQYGAADFIVTPEGEHVFLEVNPAGEFFWLEANPPHFPLVDALVDVLLDVPGARS